MTAVGPIASWNPGQGQVITSSVAPRTRQAMRTAPVDPLPPSAQQTPHLWAAHAVAAAGRDMPRLVIAAWDIRGKCDIAAMTGAINSHIRRHDTYRSSFEIVGGRIRRRTLESPDLLELTPAAMGFMTSDQARNHVLTSTPGTLDGDCFSFGVVQNAEHFSVYAAIDHLHTDGTSAGLVFGDIHLSYQALVHGLPDPLPVTGGYRAYTGHQHERIAETTLDSPEIAGWVDFARDGDWPEFPLPLGDTSGSNRGAWAVAELLDAAETEAFDAACRAAGARFSGGAMACAALADHRFTGSTTFHGLTPSDTRTGKAEALSVGWFAGLFPVTVPIGDGDFATAARTAQGSFDAGKAMATVPFQRVLELAPAEALGIGLPTGLPMMVSYMDFRKNPAAALLDYTNFGLYADNLSHGGVNLWINRHLAKTTVTISFPDNEVARQSVHRYLVALGTVFAGAAGAVATARTDELVASGSRPC